MDADSVFLVEVLSQMFGTIDGTMLTAGTAEGDLEVGEVALDETLDMMIHKGIDGVQEGEDLAVLLEEVDDGLIESGEGLVLLVFARVVGRTAVEDVTASVTGIVGRDAFFEGERINRDREVFGSYPV